MIYTFNISSEHIGVLSKALGALPYDEVESLIFDLKRQIIEQDKVNRAKVLEDLLKEAKVTSRGKRRSKLDGRT